VNSEEFAGWAESLVWEERLTAQQAEEAIRQRANFDRVRDRVELELGGRVVGFVADRLLVAESTAGLLDAAAESCGPDRQVYFEPIGMPAESAEVGAEAEWASAPPRPLARVPELSGRVAAATGAVAVLLGFVVGRLAARRRRRRREERSEKELS